MKSTKLFIIILLFFFPKVIFGQVIGTLSGKYGSLLDPNSKSYEYKDIEGVPYLNADFIDGSIYSKDSTVFKLPLRYNIYADEMEYQLKGSNYSIRNHQILNKVIIGETVFIYVPFIDNGGYFELVESGKCLLLIKSIVKYRPAESPKPIQAKSIPARFERNSDVFYFVINNSQSFKIKNKKSIAEALQDQKLKIEDFINQEKIKKIEKENLIKIVKYYNSL
jgi:hypothetical protein